ncbi:pentapeptide repeat-containing protein [Kordia sp.]|uniref:pentapeptide repeat-containing protein n=1 Tax=Kordia sp. TaxID=1965332 RepID=UPI003D6A36AA
MEKNKASYNELEQENKQLKEQLNNIESSKKFQKKAAKWTLKKGAGVFLGKGLKDAIKQTLTEFNTEKKVSTDTASNLGAHIIWRLTRIGIFAVIIAILPTLFLIIQTIYLGKQNDKIDKQNELITNQNTRLEQQTYLQEAGRRSSLVFLTNNVLDKMDDELKKTKNKDRNLSDQLIGRIVALSKSLKPYKYLENDSLSMTVSPERGQLLVNLTKAKLGEETYVKIFEDADFSFSELSDMTFEDINFGDINLSNSFFDSIIFSKCNFNESNFSSCTFDKTYFRLCLGYYLNFDNSYAINLGFNFSFIEFIDLSSSLVTQLSFHNSFSIKFTFEQSMGSNHVIDNSFIGFLNMDPKRKSPYMRYSINQYRGKNKVLKPSDFNRTTSHLFNRFNNVKPNQFIIKRLRINENACRFINNESYKNFGIIEVFKSKPNNLVGNCFANSEIMKVKNNNLGNKEYVNDEFEKSMKIFMDMIEDEKFETDSYFVKNFYKDDYENSILKIKEKAIEMIQFTSEKDFKDFINSRKVLKSRYETFKKSKHYKSDE